MAWPREVAGWACLLGLCVLACGSASAQSKAGNDGAGQGGVSVNLSAGTDAVPTLHVYANLVELPVLVVGKRWQQLPPIAADRFRVSIDGGPEYKVRHVRLEGDDPITLAIVLDMRGSQDELLKKMDDAVAGLAPTWLHARDYVTVYGLDCGLMRSLDDVAADPVMLRRGVDVLLAARSQRKTDERAERHKEDCTAGGHFWDSLGEVIREMRKIPGRRVLLVVTDGLDRGSQNKWKSVGEFAQVSAVAVFGMAFAPFTAPVVSQSFNPDLDAVCSMSGGMMMTTRPLYLNDDMKRFTKFVRGRYIVEFPRPSNATSGMHRMTVSIARSDALIRWAGISVPIADPAIMRDPTTVPEDPTLAPVQGKKAPK